MEVEVDELADDEEEDHDGVPAGQAAAHRQRPKKDCNTRKGTAYKRSKTTAMLPQLRIRPESGQQAKKGGWVQAHATQLPQDGLAFQVLQLLSEGARSNMADPRCQEWIDHLRTFAAGLPYPRQDLAFKTDSLQAMVERCSRDMEMTATLDFVGMLNRLQLVVKVERCVSILLHQRCSYMSVF